MQSRDNDVIHYGPSVTDVLQTTAVNSLCQRGWSSGFVVAA